MLFFLFFAQVGKFWETTLQDWTSPTHRTFTTRVADLSPRQVGKPFGNRSRNGLVYCPRKFHMYCPIWIISHLSTLLLKTICLSRDGNGNIFLNTFSDFPMPIANICHTDKGHNFFTYCFTIVSIDSSSSFIVLHKCADRTHTHTQGTAVRTAVLDFKHLNYSTHTKIPVQT